MSEFSPDLSPYTMEEMEKAMEGHPDAAPTGDAGLRRAALDVCAQWDDVPEAMVPKHIEALRSALAASSPSEPTREPRPVQWKAMWREWLRRVGVVTPESAMVLAHEDAAALFADFAAEWWRGLPSHSAPPAEEGKP